MENIETDIDAISSINNANTKIHIRIRQRNNKKCVTTIEELSKSFDLSLILKKMRQIFSCGGSVEKTEGGHYIQLFGDHRVSAKKFLLENSIVDEEEQIIIHGY